MRLPILALTAMWLILVLSGCSVVQCGEPEFCEIPTTNNAAITRHKGGGGMPGASF